MIKRSLTRAETLHATSLQTGDIQQQQSTPASPVLGVLYAPKTGPY